MIQANKLSVIVSPLVNVLPYDQRVLWEGLKAPGT